MTKQDGYQYDFSYTVESYVSRIDEEPRVVDDLGTPGVPVEIFAHASTMQALARYLLDTRRLRLTDAARLLGRTPQAIRASYLQTQPLPPIADDTVRIPLGVFRGSLPPLCALVDHLKARGMRNAEIARLLRLDPRTTWTAAKRAEVRA